MQWVDRQLLAATMITGDLSIREGWTVRHMPMVAVDSMTHTSLWQMLSAATVEAVPRRQPLRRTG